MCVRELLWGIIFQNGWSRASPELGGGVQSESHLRNDVYFLCRSSVCVCVCV